MAFPGDFQRRVKCTIQASLVDATLAFFPVLLTEVCLPQGNDEIFDADGLHPAQNGGGDLRFSSDEAGTNRIPCEIVTFVTDNDPANGVAEIWVAVPSISSSVDTDIWLWWEGGGSETQPAEDAAFGKENTWDENGADNFVLVQHLNEDPAGAGDRAIDSTLFDNDGNPTGGMDIADLVTGAFGAGLQGSAWDFDGNDSVALPTSASLDLEDVSFVISAWVKPIASPPTDAVFFSIHNAESANESIHVRTSSNEQIRFGYFGDDLSSATGVLTNGAWNYVVVTRDQPGDESKIFNAAVEVADGSQGPFVGPPARNDIGRWGSTDNQFYEGVIDEVRVTVGVIRADAWFGAEFENQNDPNAFIVEGTPEAVNGPSAAVTGTAQPTSTEPQIVAGGRTILITLTDDTWVGPGGAFNSQRQAIINGLTSAQSELLGWNNEVRDNLAVGSVSRTSSTLVTITLSAQAAYDITATETIEVTVPASALVTSGIPVVATPTFTVTSVAATAAITGTATATIDEDDVVAGGNTIIITLDNGSWVAAGGTFDAQRQAIIDGLDSAQVEGTGWNAEVRDKEVVTAVVRTSQKVVTITLTAQAAYDITAQETITVTVPASAINEVGAIVGTPTFTVDVGPVEATVTGTVEPDGEESEIVAGGQTIIITLINDVWVAAGVQFDAIRQLFIDGLDSAQSEATGWNAEVRDKEVVGAVVRTSDTVVTITLSAQAGYGITVQETITVTVHTVTMFSDPGQVIATPTFDILPDAATAAITGTISPISIESQIVAGGRTSIITLTNDTWVAAGGAFDGVRQAIIDGCDSAQVEAAGWNAEVRDKEVVTAVVRTSDTEVTITWSASPLYEITDNEVITVTVPAAAMVLTGIPLVASPTFTIFEVPIALVTGTVQPDAEEAEIVAGGETIILTLIDDEWVAAGATFNAVRQDIIDGLDSAGVELLGWNNEVRDNLAVTAVVRTSATVVTITLTAQAAYDITVSETITVTVPASALDQTPNPLTGVPTFDIIAAVAGSKARDRRGGRHAEDIFDVNTPNVETFEVNKFE